MASWPPLHVIGITHRKADLGLRERFARSPEDIAALLSGDGAADRTGVVLSTCNRFEVYWWGEADWAEWFLTLADRSGPPIPRAAVVRQRALPAVRHLFGVAAGLDSQVLGETEILGQVRRAWGLSRDLGATSRELDLIFAAAIAAGRRVRRETALGRHPASVGSVAVQEASAECKGLAGRMVVVVGAGEAARAVAAALLAAGARTHAVSRHVDRALALARSYPVVVEPWDQLDRLIAEADVMIAATSAPHAFLSTDRLLAAGGGRDQPLVLIDLGVPRNVDADARSLPGMKILDLDDLRNRGSGRLLELNPGLDAARLILERELVRLLVKLERWSAPVTEPGEPRARADSAG